MIVLGIETTCDETAAAVVERFEDGRGKILSNVILSQVREHAAFGGVVPEIAARAHVETLDGIIGRAMAQANCSYDTIDAIAAAGGPGLIGGVIVGLTTAKAIALVKNKPLIAVNHLDGLMPLADWHALGASETLIDVRVPDEFAAGHIPGARNLPLSQLRDRFRELSRERPLMLYCGVGQRAYYATRFLAQHGFRAGVGAIFIWEGVIAYIGAEEVDRTLRFMARLSAPAEARVNFQSYLFDDTDPTADPSSTVLAQETVTLKIAPGPTAADVLAFGESRNQSLVEFGAEVVRKPRATAHERS